MLWRPEAELFLETDSGWVTGLVSYRLDRGQCIDFEVQPTWFWI